MHAIGPIAGMVAAGNVVFTVKPETGGGISGVASATVLLIFIESFLCLGSSPLLSLCCTVAMRD